MIAKRRLILFDKISPKAKYLTRAEYLKQVFTKLGL